MEHDEAVVEQEPVEPAVEEQEAQEAQKQPADDTGIKAFFDGDAAWMRALQAVAEKEGIEDRGFAGVRLEDINDPVARQLLYNVRVMARKAASTLGMEKQSLTEERAQLEHERLKIANDHAQLMGIFQSEKVKELLEIQEPDEELDPLSPAGISHQAKLEAASFLREVFGAINKADDDIRAQAQAVVAERARQAELTELRAFVEKHPDFTQHIDEIKAIRAQANGAVKAIDVYWMLKARKGEFPTTPAAPAPEQPRVTSQRVLGRGAAGMPVPEMPDGLTAAQQLQWMEDNPEGAKQFIQRYARRR